MRLKYFSLEDSYEENKKLYRILANQYHPDKPTGNEDMMKEINMEWEKVNEYFDSGNAIPKQNRSQHFNNDIFWETIFKFSREILDDEEDELEEKRYITFNGIKYDLHDENILERIAIRHGGLSLIEFTRSKVWQDYINQL